MTITFNKQTFFATVKFLFQVAVLVGALAGGYDFYEIHMAPTGVTNNANGKSVKRVQLFDYVVEQELQRQHSTK